METEWAAGVGGFSGHFYCVLLGCMLWPNFLSSCKAAECHRTDEQGIESTIFASLVSTCGKETATYISISVERVCISVPSRCIGTADHYQSEPSPVRDVKYADMQIEVELPRPGDAFCKSHPSARMGHLCHVHLWYGYPTFIITSGLSGNQSSYLQLCLKMGSGLIWRKIGTPQGTQTNYERK